MQAWQDAKKAKEALKALYVKGLRQKARDLWINVDTYGQHTQSLHSPHTVTGTIGECPSSRALVRRDCQCMKSLTKRSGPQLNMVIIINVLRAVSTRAY